MYLNAIERTGGSFAGEDAYLEGIPAIAGLGLLEMHQPVTFLVGENGSGKSTLLEAVALALGHTMVVVLRKDVEFNLPLT